MLMNIQPLFLNELFWLFEDFQKEAHLIIFHSQTIDIAFTHN